MTTYLDWNATTPPHPFVLEAMERARVDAWANPSSVHAAGRRARQYQEDARECLAQLLRVHPRDVLFTSGGTEANHLALSGATALLTSRLEHPSIAATADALAEQGIPVRWLPVPPSGRVEVEAVRAALQELRDAGQLGARPIIALQAANHETGILQPVREVGQLALEWGVHLHVDAVQLLGRGDEAELEEAGSIAVASHKLRGPKGVGALAFRCGWTPLPLSRGGAQERGLRPGTQDAVALAGWEAALRRVPESRANYSRVAQLREEFERHILAQEGLSLHGGAAPRLSHVTNFRASGWQGDELVAALDLHGICVSSGSACSAGTAEPSPVIEAQLGREAARGAVRVSFGEESTAADLQHLLSALQALGVLTSS